MVLNKVFSLRISMDLDIYIFISVFLKLVILLINKYIKYI